MIPKEVLRKVRQIEIRTRSAVENVLSGAYTSSFKGRGMEFSEVREYVPGDEIRSIDWNVTARTGHPFVKQFVEERELTVVLAVDASASGAFGSRSASKAEVMAMLSALLAFSAVKNNDRVGLLIFTAGPEKFIPPQKGRRHVLRVIREILTFKPAARGTDLGAALEYLNRILKRRAVVILVSDFHSPPFDRPLKHLARRHDTVALLVRDPRERDLPPLGLVEFEDAESGETLLVDTSDRAFRRAFAAAEAKEGADLQGLLHRLGVDFAAVEIGADDKETMEPLLSFFRRRAQRYGHA